MSEYQKYPENKEQFDRNWIRAFGKVCPDCKGKGTLPDKYRGKVIDTLCLRCQGIGKVEK